MLYYQCTCYRYKLILLGYSGLILKTIQGHARTPQERLMEQIAGLEPASHAWQARILTICTISANCQGERITLAICYYFTKRYFFHRRHPSRHVWLVENGTLCNHISRCPQHYSYSRIKASHS